MEELVSVIVPVYNVQAHLDRCVDSLAGQTYPHLQIILVDDGSSDDSPAMCDAWAGRDHRVEVIHKVNAGAGMARNTGLDHASGSYVLFVDSDDYLDPTAIDKCVSLMKQHHTDVVMFGRNEAYADGTVKPKPMRSDRLLFDEAGVVSDILPGLFTYDRGLGTSVWGKLFDHRLIRGSGVRFCSERELLSEDACFLLELFAHIKSAAILPEQLYYYYKNENSLSRTYKSGHQTRNDAFCRRALELCRAMGYPPAVRAHVQTRYHMYAISGMKRIVGSALSAGEKSRELKAVFENELLRSTLTSDVLGVDHFRARLFWRLFKLRLYPLCRVMIGWKARR